MQKISRMAAPAIVLLFVCSIVCAAETITLVAGGGDGPDGSPALKGKVVWPFAVDFDKSGNMYIAEMKGGERVRKVDTNGILTTIAGTGKIGFSGDGGPAINAQFNGPHHLVVGPDDTTVYVADTFNHAVRKIDLKTGTISTFAGTGTKGFSGDGGPADKAQLNEAYCLARDAAFEKLYVVDLRNARVRAINMKTGVINTVAGNGQKGTPADGTDATAAPLNDPRAITLDSKGNLYILERGGNCLRVVGTDGKIKTVAGTGKPGNGDGDGGPALKATFRSPKHLCADLEDNILIADSDNHLIRKYIPANGTIVRVAGTGKAGAAGLGGPPDKAELNQPHGVYVDKTGAIFISDSTNNRVVKIQR
ncbi:MAG TPA: hypothetical protein VEK08_13575 [Planctomycetota bacterium]|nr:hypothetical protein [Planctomycetota bacterium]